MDRFFPLFLMRSPFVAVGLLALALCACSPGESAMENAAERAMERETGERADVDINGEKITVTTDDGTVEMGGSIPGDWPTDVPTYAGATVTYSAMNEADGATNAVLILSSTDSAQQIVDFYKSALTQNGWTTKNVIVSTVASGLEAEKDGRHVGIAIVGEDGSMTISIGVEMSR